MKNIRISENNHRKLKDLTAPGGLTFNDIIDKLLVGTPYTGTPYTGVPQGGNASQDSKATGYRTPEHQNTVHRNTVHQDTDTTRVEKKENQEAKNSVVMQKNGVEKKEKATFVAIPPNQEKKQIKGAKKMELTREDMQKIAREAVREEKNQDREKSRQEKSLDDLKNSLTKGLKDLEAKFCTPDGKACFVTPGELQGYLAKQKLGFEESISKKLTELAAGKPSVPLLKPVSKEIRGTLTEVQQRERDLQVKKILNQTNISANDVFRQFKADPLDWQTLQEKVFKGVSPETLINRCNLGDKESCRKLFEAQKLVVLKEGANKKWEAVYNPETEEQKPETGLFGLPRKG